MSTLRDDPGLTVSVMSDNIKNVKGEWLKSAYYNDAVRFSATIDGTDGRSYFSIQGQENLCVRHLLCDHLPEEVDYDVECEECSCICDDGESQEVDLVFFADQIPALLKIMLDVLAAADNPQIHVIQEHVAAILRGEYAH